MPERLPPRLEPGVGWTLRDVATWCGHSLEVVRDWREQAGEGFPAPIGRRTNAFVFDAGEVRAWWAHRELGDQRWPLQRIASELGVSASLVRSARRTGRLAEPDGVLRGRQWWSAATVGAWWAARAFPADAWTLDQLLEHTGLPRRVVRTTLRPPKPDGHASGRSHRVRWWWPDTVRAWWAAEAPAWLARSTWDLAAVAHYVSRTEPVTLELVSAGDLPDPIANVPGPARWQPATVRAAWREFHARHRDRGVLFGQDVAAVTGLAWDSVRTYRRLGKLPAPDGWEGHRPWWSEPTIARWDRDRRASGTGRPRLSDQTLPR